MNEYEQIADQTLKVFKAILDRAGTDIIDHIADLMRYARNQLEHEGFTRDEAVQIIIAGLTRK